MLNQEVEVFDKNMEEWLRKYANLYVVIFQGKLIGFTEKENDALQLGASTAKGATFLS